MFGKKRVDINAILDGQIEQLLRETSQFEDMLNHKIYCESCGTCITMENIGIMIPYTENSVTKLKFYCEKINCIEDYNSNG